MGTETTQAFLQRWSHYFPGAELPIALWYSDDPGDVPQPPKVSGWSCFIGQLAAVRKGTDLSFTVEHVGCGGGQTYLGFAHALRPNFEHFLSYGIPGKMEGERYKKDPDTVSQLMANTPSFSAPERYLIAKRVDKLLEGDEPQVVVFFSTPDVLSGLFALAGFEETQPQATLTPFSAGCGSLVKFPFMELASGRHWPVLGMFDVSARPYVPANTLSFSVTWPRFERMVANMDQSFLITHSWELVRKRMTAKPAE